MPGPGGPRSITRRRFSGGQRRPIGHFALIEGEGQAKLIADVLCRLGDLLLGEVTVKVIAPHVGKASLGGRGGLFRVVIDHFTAQRLANRPEEPTAVSDGHAVGLFWGLPR